MSEIDKLRIKIKNSYTELSNSNPEVTNFNPIGEMINTLNQGFIAGGKNEKLRENPNYFVLTEKDKMIPNQGDLFGNINNQFSNEDKSTIPNFIPSITQPISLYQIPPSNYSNDEDEDEDENDSLSDNSYNDIDENYELFNVPDEN